ncbi:4-hydroxyphenylacetate 3-hydroxylase family protein [Streptomyces sp. NPDC002537]
MTATGALMTGEDYLESLRDGRQVYLDGERVKDVTRHPAFRNPALSVARLYDALHDPATAGVLTGVDTATGIRTHKFFRPSRSAAELVEAREAIAAWARMGYGFLGRTPEYKASFMAGLGAGADYYGPYAANATAWYREFASKALYLNHVIINPPVDRKRAVHDMEDVFVHAVRETDAGVVVSGAKMLATGSAITNAGFVAPVGSAALAPGRAEAFALVFFVRMDNPGVKLVCRTPYARGGSPFDYPLSSRFDENDSVLLLDEALIPWEDVLVYRDIRRATGFYASSGFPNLYNFQSGTRLSVKLELMAGLLARGTRANGTDAFRGVQAAVGELITMRDMVWALTTAMAHDPEPGSGDTVVPRLEHASAMRMYNAQVWDRVHELFETTLGGAPLAVPSSGRDLANPELRPLIDRFYRGADTTALDRIKLLKLVWDAIGTEFGGRHELYERNYSGNGEQVRLDALKWATKRGSLARYEAFVQDCLDDYDLDGWRRGPWNESDGV